MKQIRKSVWYLAGCLVLGLALLAISCGGSSAEELPPAEEQEPAVEQEQPTIEEPTTEDTNVEEPAADETGTTGATPIPHGLAGQEDCVQCHGEAGFKPFPTDHTGRTSDVCQDCHQPPS